MSQKPFFNSIATENTNHGHPFFFKQTRCHSALLLYSICGNNFRRDSFVVEYRKRPPPTIRRKSDYLLFAIGGIFLILGTMYWLLDIVGFDMNPQLSKVHYILTFLALIWLLPILQSKNAASLKTWITILGLLFFVGLMVFVWNIVRGIMKG